MRFLTLHEGEEEVMKEKETPANIQRSSRYIYWIEQILFTCNSVVLKRCDEALNTRCYYMQISMSVSHSCFCFAST